MWMNIFPAFMWIKTTPLQRAHTTRISTLPWRFACALTCALRDGETVRLCASLPRAVPRDGEKDVAVPTRLDSHAGRLACGRTSTLPWRLMLTLERAPTLAPSVPSAPRRLAATRSPRVRPALCGRTVCEAM